METNLDRRKFLQGLGTAVSAAALPGTSIAEEGETRPNIMWILAEDASAHLGCYGEKTIQTPHLDAMADDGVRFDAAFVTCPVCSPCRSAMVTGMHQTTLGAHNHRSQGDRGKAGGNQAFYDSYRLPVKLIPEMFREAGYYVTLGSGPSCEKPGKTDYNFIWPNSAYDGANWRQTPDGKPFFAQIMLKGGKNRGAKKHATKPSSVELPPYYPDHPTLREDWADYLNSWVQIDVEVGEILKNLKEAGVLENTVVFFWTDHGISHVRGKQFLYEDGIRVPLIVRFPDGENSGQVRKDLVLQIDIAAASLALADIPIPEHVQGVDIFAKDYQPREMVFSARDRCDETVDIIRCVRTSRYKYIRNFIPFLPHAQSNKYKDGKAITQTMRKLHREGRLNLLQNRVFNPTRPVEELYDLETDPYETINLAERPEHKNRLAKLRGELVDWMIQSRDLGLIPEPIAEEKGKSCGNKYGILQQEENKNLTCNILRTITASDRGDVKALNAALKSKEPAIRYWAATGLGVLGDKAAILPLSKKVTESSAPIRVAAALALCRLGEGTKYAGALIDEIENDNLITGMHAIRALELSGVDNPSVRKAVEKARKNPYEFTRRIAKRMSANFQSQSAAK